MPPCGLGADEGKPGALEAEGVLGAARPAWGGAKGVEEFLELLGGHVLVGVSDVAPVLVLRQ